MSAEHQPKLVSHFDQLPIPQQRRMIRKALQKMGSPFLQDQGQIVVREGPEIIPVLHTEVNGILKRIERFLGDPEAKIF